jgi:hypothetical protein
MIFDFFTVANTSDLIDRASKEVTLFLEGYGEKKVIVTNGNYIGVQIDNVFLANNINGKSPFVFDDHCLRILDDGSIQIGFKVNED